MWVWLLGAAVRYSCWMLGRRCNCGQPCAVFGSRTVAVRAAAPLHLCLQAVENNQHPVLAVKAARVGDFNGKSLSTISTSRLTMDPPDLPEAGNLRNWCVAVLRTRWMHVPCCLAWHLQARKGGVLSTVCCLCTRMTQVADMPEASTLCENWMVPGPCSFPAYQPR